MHAVLEFAHVAAPGQRAAQRFDTRGVEAARRAAVLAAEAVDESLGQQQRVAFALAQRRQVEREQIQPVEQVLAELTGGAARLQVGVGGGDDAHVAQFDARSADRTVAAILRETQQHRLAARAERVDLVEKQRAALGVADDAAAVALGVGEGAAHMAEQFGLDHRIRNRAAVDGDERFAATRAQVMQGARGELLAGAGLAAQQHGGVDGRPLLQPGQRMAKRGRLADQVEHHPVGRGADTASLGRGPGRDLGRDAAGVVLHWCLLRKQVVVCAGAQSG